MQAAGWPGRRAAGTRSSGSVGRHSAIAIGQRGWKRQPGGIAIGFGVSPARICGSVASRGSRFGTTEMSAFVYGCFGFSTTSRAGPSSTIRPRYMTAIRSAKWAAVERSCVIMRMPSPLAPQLVEEREDPGAHGDVEHRDRLVGDEQLRVEHEARRDRHALALAAGELVRVAVEEELGRRQARRAQRVAHALLALARRRRPPRGSSSGSSTVCAHAEARVERLVRVLVDDLHRAGGAPRSSRAETLRDVLALEADRARLGLHEAEDAARSSSSRSPTRRRARASRPARSANETPSTACTALAAGRASAPTSPRGTG